MNIATLTGTPLGKGDPSDVGGTRRAESGVFRQNDTTGKGGGPHSGGVRRVDGMPGRGHLAGRPQLDVRNQILPTHHRVSLSVVVSRLADVLRFVNEHCLEGVVAKDADSRYEAGKRSGRWMRGRSSSLPHESERVSFPPRGARYSRRSSILSRRIARLPICRIGALAALGRA